MPPLSSSKREAVAALKRGEAVIFPTETVYGLGVSVEAAASPEALYDLKERDRGKPVSWLVGGVDDLDRYGAHVPDLARRLARAYWPGPLTLIVEASDAVPAAFRSAAGSIGLRMPDNDTALELIEARWPPRPRTSRVCKRRGPSTPSTPASPLASAWSWLMTATATKAASPPRSSTAPSTLRASCARAPSPKRISGRWPNARIDRSAVARALVFRKGSSRACRISDDV